MSFEIKTKFLEDVKKLGAFDINACYSCGNCTAICPLSSEDYSFPRKMIRYAMLGLEEKILSSPDIWLCYYCGDCSKSCPREADPGALMMALRRHSIRKYSLGKIADFFYSGFSSFMTWLLLTITATAGVILFHEPLPNLKKVEPLSFISLDFLHKAGLILGIFIAFFAVTHILIMVRSISKGKNYQGSAVKNFLQVLLNEVFVHSKFEDCEDRKRYIAHLALFWGFSLLFLATFLAFGVDFFDFPDIFRLFARVFGIAGGVALLYGSGFYLWKRIKAKDTYSKFSHHSDWIFIILMFLAGLTGMLMDFFHLLNLPWPAYITFALHLIIVFDLLITAPFTKFAHAIYRPLALWISRIYKPEKTTATETSV